MSPDSRYRSMVRALAGESSGLAEIMWVKNRENFAGLFSEVKREDHDLALNSVFLGSGIAAVSSHPPWVGFREHPFLAEVAALPPVVPTETIQWALESCDDITRMANEQYRLNLERHSEQFASEEFPEGFRFSIGFVFFKKLSEIAGGPRPDPNEVYQAAMVIGGIVREFTVRWYLAASSLAE